MPTSQMRPTFLVETKLKTSDVIERIRVAVHERGETYTGQYSNHHAMVSIVKPKRHFWSPWLNVDMHDHGDHREVIARFSPHPSIWTGVMFSYLSLVVLSFFGLILGVSQQLAGQSAWAYFVIPVCVLVAALIWFAAQAGQKLARSEMQDLKTVVEECLQTNRTEAMTEMAN